MVWTSRDIAIGLTEHTIFGGTGRSGGHCHDDHAMFVWSGLLSVNCSCVDLSGGVLLPLVVYNSSIFQLQFSSRFSDLNYYSLLRERKKPRRLLSRAFGSSCQSSPRPQHITSRPHRATWTPCPPTPAFAGQTARPPSSHGRCRSCAPWPEPDQSCLEPRVRVHALHAQHPRSEPLVVPAHAWTPPCWSMREGERLRRKRVTEYTFNPSVAVPAYGWTSPSWT